ncbi:Multifunctional cytochrome P450 monooxygenase af510 [Sparassis crispa]|uniref:Multifunctional cytochrome P450 monooxygenase af510 n=1 Tax=Sparassis crispa TaxID=139825 RepID=A0A401H7D8_9APHY|nr:Multifunctional cytochrome P450 monooxygenase af510 [Sparassis crispa]GBE90250.1 Multifunctional cytochrome P450 monooxygenase af510 [Sparassis crispa]
MVSAMIYAVCACAVVALIFLKGGRRRASPLPPGPAAHPIIGHLLKFDPAHQYELFRRWANDYGDLFHLRILGQTMIIVNSLNVATELMEKRSSNYSDRPDCTTIEMMGYEMNLVLLRYGPKWRKLRRMFQEYLNSRMSPVYQATQLREAHVVLNKLLVAPTEIRSATHRFALATALEVAYGIRILSDDDVNIELAEAAIGGVEEATAGVSLIDMFPFLKDVPHWLPGCSFLTTVPRYWRPATRRMIEVPFNNVRRQMAAGVAPPSFAASLLERLDVNNVGVEDLKDIEGAASTVHSAGTETTWSSLQLFFLAMMLFPEAQRKAQEEIARVVGVNRLPDFSDREALPYLECVLQETSRWHPAVPLGIPHRSLHDDVYNGMFIPKGSFIIPHVTAMSRDAKVYKNADDFYPERFLPAPAGYGEPHLSAAFGFGRRICPGRHLAGNSTWIVAATVLAAFTINKPIGKDGQVIEQKIEFLTGGQTSPPKPFECVVRSRSDKMVEVIMQLSD